MTVLTCRSTPSGWSAAGSCGRRRLTALSRSAQPSWPICLTAGQFATHAPMRAIPLETLATRKGILTRRGRTRPAVIALQRLCGLFGRDLALTGTAASGASSPIRCVVSYRPQSAETPTQLASMDAYRPGRIPVVFVHGTASSAGRWGDMVNDLLDDPRIRDRYQFWFFTYDTGNPVLYSASLLREALSDAVRKLDPKGTDPALSEMVVIGHSQGGLLAKAMVVDTGDRVWDAIAYKP